MSALRNRATPAKYSGQLNANGTRWREDHERLLAYWHPVDHSPPTTGTLTRTNESAYIRERFDALRTALTQPVVVMCEAPFVLRNAGNGSQGASMAGRHVRNETRKAQRQLGAMFARELLKYVFKAPFYVVVLTRIAPRSLDGNNLDHTFKSVVDGIAEGLGINDRSSLVRYVTAQEAGKVPRVRAELFIEPKP